MTVSGRTSQSSSTPLPTFLTRHFIAGGGALAISFAVMHPLDVLKTRMQAGVANSRIFTRETLRALSKGFVVSTVGAAFQGGTRLATYELTRKYIHPSSKNSYMPFLNPTAATALSAIVGDIASSVIKVPREVITVRMQTAKAADATANSAWSMARTVIKQEGVAGLFRGFTTITARDCPFMVILFVCYEFMHSNSHRQLQRTHSSLPIHDLRPVPGTVASSQLEFPAKVPALKSALFGGVSGFLAGYLTTPMDVMRAQIMANSQRNPSGMWAMARQIAGNVVQQQGSRGGFARAAAMYRAFFVGAMPRSIWWFCVCSMFFSQRSYFLSLLGEEDL
ncbi:uncharacterized protein VTP21DRAFT_4996 [Calcarisporiella thermophila]|uniref:uncharacterized protein n=1 Tax=Calcarisporiella thermophila TaxID=911321 RepID=UPI003743CC87